MAMREGYGSITLGHEVDLKAYKNVKYMGELNGQTLVQLDGKEIAIIGSKPKEIDWKLEVEGLLHNLDIRNDIEAMKHFAAVMMGLEENPPEEDDNEFKAAAYRSIDRFWIMIIHKMNENFRGIDMAFMSCKFYKSMGIIHQNYDDHQKAMNYFDSCYDVTFHYLEAWKSKTEYADEVLDFLFEKYSRDLIKDGKSEEAIAKLDKYLSIVRNNPPLPKDKIFANALGMKGYVYMKDKKYPEALKYARKGLKTYQMLGLDGQINEKGGVRNVFEVIAIAHYHLENWQLAQTVIGKLMSGKKMMAKAAFGEQDQNYIKFMFFDADCHHKTQGDLKKSLVKYQFCINVVDKMKSKIFEFAELRHLYHEALEKIPKIENELKLAISRRDHTYVAKAFYSIKQRLHCTDINPDEALKNVDELLETKESRKDWVEDEDELRSLLAFKSHCLTLCGRMGEAIEIVDKAMTIRHLGIEAFELAETKCEAWFKLGFYDESIDHLKKVLHNYKSVAGAPLVLNQVASLTLHLAYCYIHQREYQSALETLSEVKALVVRNPKLLKESGIGVKLHDYFGLCYYELRNYNKAMDFFQKADQAFVKSTSIASPDIICDFHFHFGKCLIKTRKFCAAIYKLQIAFKAICEAKCMKTDRLQRIRYAFPVAYYERGRHNEYRFAQQALTCLIMSPFETEFPDMVRILPMLEEEDERKFFKYVNQVLIKGDKLLWRDGSSRNGPLTMKGLEKNPSTMHLAIFRSKLDEFRGLKNSLFLNRFVRNKLNLIV